MDTMLSHPRCSRPNAAVCVTAERYHERRGILSNLSSLKRSKHTSKHILGGIMGAHYDALVARIEGVWCLVVHFEIACEQ